MNTTSITCPHCKKNIELSQALSHDLEEKINIQKEKEFEDRLQKEKIEMWKKAQEKAQEKQLLELQTLKSELEEKDKRMKEAQNAELELRKQKNQLEEDKRAFELEKQRQLDAEREKIRTDVSKMISEQHQLKETEYQKQINDLKKSLDDAQRKASQTSQQLQGEVLELEMEHMLKNEFPQDTIEPVPKGVLGADIVQKVFAKNGTPAGTIVWESKRTKAWSEQWVQKLKEDQRSITADMAVLISIVLPKDVRSFGFRDGIYVGNYESVIGIAYILRNTLLQIAQTKIISSGKQEKMEIIYNYLSGTEFKQRVEAIIESFTYMKNDLDHEKRAMMKIWAKREKQIQQVLNNTIGFHGDLQGLMGQKLPEIKQLELDDPDQLGLEDL